MKFRISGQPGIVFNLPSKKRGDGGVLVGKVVADLNGLKSSQSAEFKVLSLTRFSDELKTMDQTLKGSTSIESLCNAFFLSLEITSVGHVLVRYRMSTSEHAQPNDVIWNVNGEFQFEPSKINAIVKEIENAS